MRCPKCNAENPENAQVCQSCSSVLSSFSAPPDMPKAKTSALAIWSFVLSIVGLFTCMITSLPALICGIVGLVKINNSKGGLKGSGLAITGIVIPAISIILLPIFAMILAIMMPALGKARSTAQQMVCITNLSGIGKAMMLYANDYNDEFPPADRWCDLLVEKCDVAPEQFCCPSSGAKEGESSYVFNINLAGRKMSQVPPDTVMLFETKVRKKRCGSSGCYSEPEAADKKFWNVAGGPELLSTENHQGDGCSIVFVDGHAKFVRSEDLPTLRWTSE